MFFMLLALFFGLLTAFRISHAHISQRFMSSDDAKTVLVVLALVQLGAVCVISNRIISVLTASMLPIALIHIVYIIKIHFRESRFKDNFCHQLDLMMLEMRSGKSFRLSLQAVAQRQEMFIRHKLMTLHEGITFSPTAEIKDKFLAEIFKEFAIIDKNPHNGLNRLQTLRYRFRIMSDYRRKSGQACIQARVQGFVLFGLYFATLIFMSKNFSIRQNKDLLALSLLLFTIGTIMILTIGGRFRWKI